MFSQPRTVDTGRTHQQKDSLDDLNIRFIIHGLNSSPRTSCLDFYIPQLRHNFGSGDTVTSTQNPIQCLSTIATWKGITQHAEELLKWEQCLKACLENLVSVTVVNEFRKSVKRQIFKWNPTVAGQWLCYFVKRAGRKNVNILLEDLLSDIIELYNDYVADAERSFLASGGDFRVSLCKFLRTYDCFKDLSNGYASIEIDLDAKSSGHHKIDLSGTVHSHQPDVNFHDFKAVLYAGTSCFLLPRYLEPLLSDAYPSGELPHYHISSDFLPWQWNNGMVGFHCKVPFNRSGKSAEHPLIYSSFESHMKATSDIKATFTLVFANGVRFQRVSRFRIRQAIENDPSVKIDASMTWPNANMQRQDSVMVSASPHKSKSMHAVRIAPSRKRARLDSAATAATFKAPWANRPKQSTHADLDPATFNALEKIRTMKAEFTKASDMSHEAHIDDSLFMPSLNHIPATGMSYKEFSTERWPRRQVRSGAKWNTVRLPHVSRPGNDVEQDENMDFTAECFTEAQSKQQPCQEWNLYNEPQNVSQEHDIDLKVDLLSSIHTEEGTLESPLSPKSLASSGSLRQYCVAAQETLHPLRVVNYHEDDYSSSDESYSASQTEHKRFDSVISQTDHDQLVMTAHPVPSLKSFRRDISSDQSLKSVSGCSNATSPGSTNENAAGEYTGGKDSVHICNADGRSLSVSEDQADSVIEDMRRHLESSLGVGKHGPNDMQAIRMPNPTQEDILRYFEECLAEKAKETDGELSKQGKDMDEEKVYESIFLEDDGSNANSPVVTALGIHEDSMLGSSEICDGGIDADRE